MLFVVVTLGSFGFNWVTAGRAQVPRGLLYVQAGDVRTRYRVWGTQGPQVVLVHGSFESADAWAPMAEVLGRDHRVYALDLTGFGYSEHRKPYDAKHMAEQVLGFVKALGLQRPVLVGHSSGAAVVAEAAIRGAGVGGVVFVDGDALPTGAGAASPVSYLFWDPYRTSLLRLGLKSDRLVRAAYSRVCGPKCARLDAAGVDQWTRPFRVKGAEQAAWAMLRAGVVGIPAGRLELLRGLPMPKGVVFGSEDSVFSKDAPQETARRIGACPPVIVPGARHLPMISDPAVVAGAVSGLRSCA
ncbi:alpha/beta hydrolase [Actinomadura barringtoniae]|uniref:Alpha/beta hydrolase n=1 Tax=Actinomadura barringtoniae TaxID=1427535 RepID=A0A939PQZ3_9ACTN|nr:alpha/beta hydrolase [Actinomadura barringtoniae]